MMTNAVKHPLLGDTLYSCTHKSGLRIVVWPQAEASSVYALFATHYGSVNNTLTTPDGGTEVVPEGIAHYLEHKLFEGENGEDAFTRYAQTGANANAKKGSKCRRHAGKWLRTAAPLHGISDRVF